MNFCSWEEIQAQFAEGIIIGNGASRAINERFSYDSLFEEAKQNDLITTNAAKVFEYLETKDFERVLELLWHAYHVNKALNIDEPKTSRAYKDLQAALIKSVRRIHSEYEQVKGNLLQMATFLKRFETVVSLNYDFLVYWAMLAGNDEWKQLWFKDCFINGNFDADWQRLREGHGGAERSTLVFYPHGNLVLATDLDGVEHKLAIGNEFGNLLNTVVSKWKTRKYTPLFVSEGTSKQKLKAIKRSPYLKTVYDSVLGDLGSRVVVFGWSMRDQDDHILKAISSNDDLKALAVSVVKAGDIKNKCAHIEEKIRKTKGGRKVDVVFFNAKSKGCWVNS